MEPEHIDTVLDRANRLLEAGKPDESLRCLDQVDGQLVDSDDRIECAALRAYALSEMGRAEEALQTLEPLIEEFPESVLFGALGVVLSGANDLEQAREALETAIALDQEDETLLANLALVYERLRDYATAVELYDRAIDLGADLDWALRRRATALVESGDSAAARATLKRYLSLVPDDAEQWVSLAILHSDDEQYEDAFACYQRRAGRGRLTGAAAELGRDGGAGGASGRCPPAARFFTAARSGFRPPTTVAGLHPGGAG